MARHEPSDIVKYLVKQSRNAMMIPFHSAVFYDDRTTRVDPYTTNSMKELAQLAMDVYNKTHIKKYSCVELVHVSARRLANLFMDMIFTAKHDGDDKTFRARVCSSKHYVDYVGFQKNHDQDENLETMKKFPEEDEKIKRNGIAISDSSSVWYDRDIDPTRCEFKTMTVLSQCAELALEVYNNTHPTGYSLDELVQATGHLSVSTGFMVDMMFTGEWGCDDKKTFRARVSITHNYVEFVHSVLPDGSIEECENEYLVQLACNGG